MASNTNARKEFIAHIGRRDILCAQVIKSSYYDDEYNIVANLTTGWTKEDWDEFLLKIDFNYDSGYGSQQLYGTIWYSDGTWSERGEYDGSEWWQYNDCPDIPEELNRIDKVRDKKLGDLGV